MHRRGRKDLLLRVGLAVLAVVTAGCAGTQSTSNTIKTLHEVGQAAPFDKVLVIGVAGEVPSRVRFEQELVKALSGDNSVATAFYTIVGRNALLTRTSLNTVIRAREFDAVVFTRMKGQDRADLNPGRPTGRRFDLFRYDYEELNVPVPISTATTVSFVVEVYDAQAKQKIWAIESLVFDARSVDSALSDQVANIAAEIRKDGLVRP